MKVAFWLLTTFNLLSSCPSHAQEIYSFYKGIRQMGMGGASIAVVNDETALLLNPAGLGKLRDYFITIADPELEAGVHTEAITGSKDILQMQDPQKALTDCKANPDLHMHERAQVFPSIVVPNFGFGVLGKYQIDGQFSSAKNTFDYEYTNDYAAVFGFDFRFLDGIIKVGTNARITNRTQVSNSSIAANSTNLALSSMASSGVGVGTDTGMIITLPVAYLPTLAAVYRDVGRTAYDLRGGMFMSTTTKPDSTPDTVDVALAINPILGKRWRSSWTVEYQDVLTYSQETDQFRRIHAGVEFNFADAFFIRGGLNQHYWTAGLELAVSNYQLQLASYGEDIGTPSAPFEDRRYEAKFAFRF